MMDDPPASRLRILIVEDDRVTARDLEGTLQRRGFVVAGVAHSAPEALDLARRREPGIALVDVHLDNADEGIELGRALRKDHGIAVVFVTGFSEEALFEQARGARPAGFVRKPFSEAELAACLEAVEERSRTQEDLADRIPGLEAVACEVSQAVIASDLDGAILFLNRPAEALTGWSTEDARGAPLAKVAPLADPPQEGGDREAHRRIGRLPARRPHHAHGRKAIRRGAVRTHQVHRRRGPRARHRARGSRPDRGIR